MGLLFVAVTSVTLALSLTDPDYAETDPVSDLAFLVLGTVMVVGFISQLRPHCRPIGFWLALVGASTLAVAGLAGRRIEPLVGGIIILAAVGMLLALHPAPTRLVRPFAASRSRPDVALLALAGAAGIPAVWKAVELLGDARAAGPSCFLGKCARGDRLAELAAALVALVLVAALGASRPPGWRLALWAATGGAAVIGIASVALPAASGSLGTVGGALTVGWAVLLAVVSKRGNLHRERPEPAAPATSEGASTMRAHDPETRSSRKEVS